MCAYLTEFDSPGSFLGYLNQFESYYTPDLDPSIYPYLSPII